MNLKDIRLAKDFLHTMKFCHVTEWQKKDLIKTIQDVIDKSKSDPDDSDDIKAQKEMDIYQASELIRYIKREMNTKINEDDDDETTRPLIYKVNNLMLINDIFLSQDIRHEIDAFILRYQKRDILKQNNLPWGNKILLAGPPGNGKTALAGAIAKKFNLPLFQLDAGLIENHLLGSTARNIVNAFNQVKEKSPCVFLFDECDSYATKRLYDSGGSIEMSHALNIMLQQLDALNEKIIFIVTTNVYKELDPAFLRRFSMKLYLSQPTALMIKKYVSKYQKEHDIDFSEEDIKNTMELTGQPWSKVEEYCQIIHQNRLLGLNIFPKAGCVGQTSTLAGFQYPPIGSE